MYTQGRVTPKVFKLMFKTGTFTLYYEHFFQEAIKKKSRAKQVNKLQKKEKQKEKTLHTM
uniref:Uncharacterized protein n=1 Tax=Anguilla anguilla TaxID=7936 RepID=A0A0E9XC42_ANGAN